MPDQKGKQLAQIMAKYLNEGKVLIADTSAASRSGLFSVMQELGCKTNNITMVNTFEHAQEAVTLTKPQIVIAEYDLGKRCGLELLQSQREQRPEETKESLFIVVTSNTSQTAVARAAEEDVDAYVIKPYTKETVRKGIQDAVIRKVSPSQYYSLIEEGKKLLFSGKMDEAEQLFNKAKDQDPTPSLAYYYLGQVKFLRQIFEQSKGSYEKGLEFNRIHYKCLVGMYELLMQQNAHRDAYEVVKKIARYFPANPKRLTEVLRLAVVTAQYEDIEKYYAIFTNIDERNETLVRYICAALVVCGKYYLSSGLGHSRAIELFRKAAATGQGRVGVLKEIVQTLLEYGLAKETKPFMERFPPESFDTEEFLILRFLLADAEGHIQTVIDQGRALIAKGATDERIFSKLIPRAVEARLSQSAIEEILNKAIECHPAKRAEFEELLQKSRIQSAA